MRRRLSGSVVPRLRAVVVAPPPLPPRGAFARWTPPTAPVAAAAAESRPRGAQDAPPGWLEGVCRDLFFRNGTEDGVSDALSPQKGEDDEGHVDPLAFVGFELLDVGEYIVGPYAFPEGGYFSEETKLLLCLNDVEKEYVTFGYAYAFPDRRQLPTSIGTERAALIYDPSGPPCVFIQLGPSFPPATWLPVAPSAAAIRRVLGEFAAAATKHQRDHHTDFEERWERATTSMKQQGMPIEPHRVLRYLGVDARDRHVSTVPIQEFENSQEFFLGEYDDPEQLLEHFDLCPFTFAIPLMRTVADPHEQGMVPTVQGPGVCLSLFRTVYSKSLVLLQVHLSCEVKLPPQDLEGFKLLWSEHEGNVAPASKIPVFARVMWPENERLSGGGQLIDRLNKLLGTEFARDMPIDSAMALYYCMCWAKKEDDFLGVLGMRERVDALAEVAARPSPPLSYPSTRDIPNPEYTPMESYAMHLQYLAHLCDPDVAQRIERLLPSANAVLRMGLAKAALECGDRGLFFRIVSKEPPGRIRHYMTTLIRHRRKRDVLNADEPLIFDEQYEFPAPLWTATGQRIDPTSIEGALDMQRLAKSGNIRARK